VRRASRDKRHLQTQSNGAHLRVRWNAVALLTSEVSSKKSVSFTLLVLQTSDLLVFPVPAFKLLTGQSMTLKDHTESRSCIGGANVCGVHADLLW
jgi:hypothetical protein